MLTPLEMSLSGGILIAAVVIIRALSIHRLPKKAFLVLWAVALGRLLIPVSITSPVSVYAAVERAGVTVGRPGVLAQQGAEAAQGTTVFPTALLIWAVVAAALALLFLIAHLRSRRMYAASLPVEHAFVGSWMDSHRLRRPVRVRYSDRVDTPLTYGVLWPVILLPKSLDWEDETCLGFILAHEMAHIRRFDALIKWILAATVCLHWFNPLVWLMYILASRDLELSCDETVVHMYGAAARGSYARALVCLAQTHCRFAPLSSGFSKNAMRERIAAIMKSKKTTVVGIVVALLLVAAVVTVFATSSPSQKQPESQSIAAPPTSRPIGGVVIQAKAGTAVAQESPFGVEDLSASTYTKAQYNQIAALKTAGYEALSIAEFNRTLNAKLTDDSQQLQLAFELLLSDLPADDPLTPFVCNTMQTSMNEYNNRLDEVYSGKEKDHEFWASNTVSEKTDVFGDPVEIIKADASYVIRYRILDQDKLTVGQRDQFLQDILAGVQTWMQTLSAGKLTDAQIEVELDRIGKAVTNQNIACTGVTLEYFDRFSGDMAAAAVEESAW